jgi:hypothetical protein
MKGAPDPATIIEGGPNYCWAATRSEDRLKLHIDLWVLQGDSWSTVAGSGFSLDRSSAQKLCPILDAFLAPAPERR